MLNKTYLGEVITGLAIVAHSVPEGLTDANGDNIRDGLMQGLHDLADELKLGREVNLNAAGEPADVVPVDRGSLCRVQATVDFLNLIMGHLGEK